MKIRSVRAKLFHAEGWTDKTKLTDAFRNFRNAPKRSSWRKDLEGSILHPEMCNYSKSENENLNCTPNLRNT